MRNRTRSWPCPRTPTTSFSPRPAWIRRASSASSTTPWRNARTASSILEYAQSESLAFDDGRLKNASFDTTQGFGLRAVVGESTGFAHASNLSEEAIIRAAKAVEAVKSGHSGAMSLGPAGTNRHLYAADNPLEEVGFDAKVALLKEIDAYARAKDSRVRQVTASLAGEWQAVMIIRADGQIARDIRPLVRLNISIMVGDGDRQEIGSIGYGGREAYARFIDPANWRGRVDEALRQALVNLNSVAAPAGEMPVVLGPGWPGDPAARGDRPRPRRRFQSQEDLRLRRPDGPAGRRQGRDRGGRRQHPGPPRLLDHRRRRHADLPHGPDRGRHPERLSPGPAQRPAHEHEADRQRPSRKLRPCSHAAHDQHLHAGRRQGSRRDHRGREERHLRRQFRRRAGGHHQRQIRVQLHRGLQDRERQDRRPA